MAVCKLYAALGSELRPERLREFLVQMLSPLVRMVVVAEAMDSAEKRDIAATAAARRATRGRRGKAAGKAAAAAARVSEQQSPESVLGALAQEVLGSLEIRAGSEAFMQAYAKVREHIAARKQSRKRERAQEAVREPEVHAAKKRAKYASKRRGKQQRINRERARAGKAMRPLRPKGAGKE